MICLCFLLVGVQVLRVCFLLLGAREVSAPPFGFTGEHCVEYQQHCSPLSISVYFSPRRDILNTSYELDVLDTLDMLDTLDTQVIGEFSEDIYCLTKDHCCWDYEVWHQGHLGVC